jgi:hypothetical protein
LIARKEMDIKIIFLELLSSLRNYGQHFDFPELRSELITVYSTEDFSWKSKSETVKFFRQTGMAEAGFSEVYKLWFLILTISASSVSVEYSFPTL